MILMFLFDDVNVSVRVFDNKTGSKSYPEKQSHDLILDHNQLTGSRFHGKLHVKIEEQ